MIDFSLLDIGKAAVLGVVEGVTEFLPISSTGHLIVAGDVLRFGAAGTATSSESAKAFEIFIQLGSILSVVWMYRKKILPPRDESADSDFSAGWMKFWMKVLVSFFPAAVVGLALHSYITNHLFTVPTVAISLIVGGVVILGVEALVKEKREGAGSAPAVHSVQNIGFLQALFIGIAQVLALIPGVSRSGATIMAGLLQKLDRKMATEYSFFLAIPTMLAATLFDLFKNRNALHSSDALIFGVGFVVAFVTALIAICTFLKFISSHSFKAFAWYRIVFGLLLLALLQMGTIGVV